MGLKKHLLIAVFWFVVAGAVLTVDYLLTWGWFAVRLFGVTISLGWAILLLAGLNLYMYFYIQSMVRLTPEEIAQYSGRLEAAVPEIMSLIAQKVKAGEIADRILQSHKIPRIVTLKFLIALGEARRKMKKEG